MRIDDRLLNALADRWPLIQPDWPGQTFEAWISRRMDYYNEFGYPRPYNETLIWFDSFPPTLWDLVDEFPACIYDDYVQAEANKLRQIGGTMIQRVRDLKPLVKVMMEVN